MRRVPIAGGETQKAQVQPLPGTAHSLAKAKEQKAAVGQSHRSLEKITAEACSSLHKFYNLFPGHANTPSPEPSSHIPLALMKSYAESAGESHALCGLMSSVCGT
jgi:hypothetical protein